MIQVIDFYAEWCAPCKALSPIIDQLRDDYKDRVTFLKADVEKEEDLALIHNIRNVPTIIIIENGEQVARFTGMMTRQKLKEMIDTWV